MINTKDTIEKDILDDLFASMDLHDDPKLNDLLNFVENMGEMLGPEKKISKINGSTLKKRKRTIRSSSYLSRENFMALNQAKAECQKMLMTNTSRLVSKSRITGISLEIILKDFQINKEKSILAQHLIMLAQRKQNQ